MKKSILRVGVVKSVRGRTIEVVVDKMKNVPHLLYEGTVIRNVSVGSYVKINKGFERIIGLIESEEITEDKSEVPKDYKHKKNKIIRVLRLKTVGFLEGEKFNQGVKELPLIDNVCYILTKEEYDRVHNFVDDKEDEPIKLGHLSSELTKEISVGVNSLFASHIGIFGNTGSGKSYSLASIYHSLFEKFGKNPGFKKHSKFLLIDFNGEYLENEEGKDIICSTDHKVIYDVPKKKLKLNKKSFENIEVLSLILDATDKTQKPFIKNVLNYKKFQQTDFSPLFFLKNYIIKNLLTKKDNELGIKVLVNIFYDIGTCVIKKDPVLDTISFIQEDLGYNSTTNGYYLKVKGEEVYDQTEIFEKIKEHTDNIKLIDENLLIDFLIKLILKFYYDIINGHANIEHISPLIRRAKTTLIKLNEIIDIKENVGFEKNLSVISLKKINDNSLKKILALVICKEAYDAQKSSEPSRSYLNIIIDEAHNLLSYSSKRESETWKDYRLETFEEIIKEGRKFGTFLTIASQRPNDISPTIISQLHNYFLHRLINNKDIEAIEKTVSYLDKVSFEALSILPTGTCILAGLAAKLPVMIKMNKLDERYQPHSKTIRLTDIWHAEPEEETKSVGQEQENFPESDDNLIGHNWEEDVDDDELFDLSEEEDLPF